MFKYAPFILLGIACTDVKSSGINTNGMYAEISAVVQSTNQTKVDVILRVGDANSNTFIELDAGDTIEASDGTTTEELNHSSFGSIHSYSQFFNSIDEGTAFTISLSRELETSAPSSIAILPAGFTLRQPELGFEISRDTDLDIQWEGSGEDTEMMMIEVTGTCIFSITKEVPFNDNAYTVPSTEFESIGSDETSEGCELQLVLQRKKEGTLDPAYGAGDIFGGVLQTQTIQFTP